MIDLVMVNGVWIQLRIAAVNVMSGFITVINWQAYVGGCLSIFTTYSGMLAERFLKDVK